MKISTVTVVVVLLAGSLGVALAAENGTRAGSIMTVQTTPMTDAQIQQKLQSGGYSNVQITGHDKNQIDVTATKDGATQKLTVNSQTGASTADTDKDDDD